MAGKEPQLHVVIHFVGNSPPLNMNSISLEEAHRVLAALNESRSTPLVMRGDDGTAAFVNTANVTFAEIVTGRR